MTNEEHEDIHTAFWAGVDAVRNGDNLVRAFILMMERIEERQIYRKEEDRLREGDFKR